MPLTRRRVLKLLALSSVSAPARCSEPSREPVSSRVSKSGSIRPAASVRGQGFEVVVDQRGALAVAAAGERYVVRSSYSYPGNKIGWNSLGHENEEEEEEEWKPRISAQGAGQVRVGATGKFYELARTISVDGARIGVQDALTNVTDAEVAVLIRHRFATARQPRRILLAGADEATMSGRLRYYAKEILRAVDLYRRDIVTHFAENPSVLVSQSRSHLGFVAEDTTSRLQFRTELEVDGASVSLRHFSLRPGLSRTLRWSLYPLNENADYFTFVNEVRSDWKTNFTIYGPFAFFDVTMNRDLLENQALLESYVRRNRLKIVAFRPWLEYDNFDWRNGGAVWRQEYKELARRAMAAFKAVDPDIRCVGCVQSCFVSLPDEVTRALYEAAPAELREQAVYRFTDEQMRIIRDVPLGWNDARIVASDGRYIYELYYDGPDKMPRMALGVYAAPGNSQFKYLMDQARFIMEEAGLDGMYIDGFSLAFASEFLRYSYDRWDGVTVDIDPRTGNISRRYTDTSFVGVPARKRLVEYVLSRKGAVVANTHPAAEEIQSFPIMRFLEGSTGVDVLRRRFREGEEPPLARTFCKGHLGSPIALGVQQPKERPVADGGEAYATRVMQAAITYLRHGLVYYHFFMSEVGPPAWRDGPIDRMFPLTPVALHKGRIVGKERIVTAVSGSYRWPHASQPKVYRFNRSGREAPAVVETSGRAGDWTVGVTLRDWAEIAIIQS